MISHYRHPVLFYVLATALSWAFWFAAGYVSYLDPGQINVARYASILGFLGLISPLLAAIWLISRDGLWADIRGRMFNFTSVRLAYMLMALLLMPGSILLAMALSLLIGHSASQFVITGHYTFTSGVFPVWFLLIMAPVIEELAWHSYGTDALRARFNLLTTSLIFAFFWGLWHLPLAGIKDYFLSNVVAEGWIYSANFLVSIFPFVIIMNWIYYKTGRNIVLPIIFHITAGYFNEIFATDPDSKVIQTGILLVVMLILLARDRQFFLTRSTAGLQ